jgi:hypothetical protein
LPAYGRTATGEKRATLFAGHSDRERSLQF